MTEHQAQLTAQGYIRGSPTGRVAYIRLLSAQGGVGQERLEKDKEATFGGGVQAIRGFQLSRLLRGWRSWTQELRAQENSRR